MLHSAKFHYDASSALSQGQRDNQEDAIVADFPVGTEMGFAVLSDGMGGHASGEVASKIVVTEVFSELKLMAGDLEDQEQNIASVLREAAIGANECLHHHANASPESLGMGATLVAPVLIKDRLYWISIGDSPLYLFRDNKLHRLNEDHSLTPQFDYLVSKGMMEAEEALTHPDRNCLTSVLVGKEIPKIDCPKKPIQLLVGDIVIAASDGLQFLDEDKISEILEAQSDNSSAAVSSELLRVLNDLNDPDQDNVSVCIIKVSQQQTEMVKTDPSIAATAAEIPRPVSQLIQARAISAIRSTPSAKYQCKVSIERAAKQ